MNVGSLFSGIGGLDLGLARAGFEHEFFCEIDPYRRAVLARHWPGVRIYENVREVAPSGGQGRPGEVDGESGGTDAQRVRHERGEGHAVDLLAGGFPCQDLSVAGRRAGLAGERSSLFFEFARVADALVGPGGWILIENVPGLLSSNGGRDFAIVLATLAELGFHDLAWRVLDSRYFGVPQRRRRVFIVGRRAGGRRAQQVLLEPEGGGGDFEAGREARTGVAGSVADGAQSARSLASSERWDGETEDFIAGTLGGRSDGAGGFRQDLDGSGAYIPVDRYWVEDFENGTLTAAGQHGGAPRSDRNPLTLSPSPDPDRVRTPPGVAGRVDGADRAEPFTFETRVARNGRGAPSDTVNALKAEAGQTGRGDAAPMVVAAPLSHGSNPNSNAAGRRREDDVNLIAGPLGGGNDGIGRRTEDDPNLVGRAGDAMSPIDPLPDGRRYAACGDAVTANVAEWIGRRLLEFGS